MGTMFDSGKLLLCMELGVVFSARKKDYKIGSEASRI